MRQRGNTLTLNDFGGFFFFLVLFGIPFGSIADYLWNLLVFSLTVPRLSIGSYLGMGHRLAYSLFVTILGLVIDLAYLELTWDTDFMGKSAVWAPAMAMPLQLALLIVPMIMIALVNFALSYSFLRFDRRQAIVLGVVMGVFTAPWLLPIVPYVAGWVK